MAKKTPKSVETFIHDEATRKYIPTAEYQSVLREDDQSPLKIAYSRRNRDLDPQLVWRGKDEQDWSDLVVPAPPLYIQEKVHPIVLIDDLRQQTKLEQKKGWPHQLDLFADFNGLPDQAAKTEFYQHEANWTNRMILGDSLQVMASLAEREGLRGQVQCIYIDPPYGIKFNSNFQWSTTSRSVTDGKVDHITREPEQVKAFRDTWKDGIHSYLTYLRERLTVARDLLTDVGSIFIQISDENVHRVRMLMDEVYGETNFCAMISFEKTRSQTSDLIAPINDYLLWYCKDKSRVKYRALMMEKTFGEEGTTQYRYIQLSSGEKRRLIKQELENINLIPENAEIFSPSPLVSESASESTTQDVEIFGKTFRPSKGGWKTNVLGFDRLKKSDRLMVIGNTPMYRRFYKDYPYLQYANHWKDVFMTGFSEPKTYVVQTSSKAITRCVLMTTDPGDLVIDPTCGSGTTAYVAEHWGRRWITIDTSRVALVLARARIMGARYPYYLLVDSREGQFKDAEITNKAPSQNQTHGRIRQGFVYERVPHIMLKNIVNNAEIDVIWEKYQQILDPIRLQINQALSVTWQDWEVPRKPKDSWPQEVKNLHVQWWQGRNTRQHEIDASISSKADFEYLYDKPYEDNSKVRVAGPFTVESLSPHRILAVDENDELICVGIGEKSASSEGQDFAQMILENLKSAGVQQAHKEDKIDFNALTPWPGHYICAEGRYFGGGQEKGVEKRAAIFIGPEFGTVARPDLVAAAREAGDAGFDVLITCAFNYDAHSTEFDKLGRIPVLKARMNADLHMAGDLKNTGKGNLFVIFGEPDIDILDAEDGQIRVKINGVDVFHPNTGEVRSDGAEGIACWFIDTDYNEESFFVRQAYFLGANDPYQSLKTTLKAEINQEAWDSLHSDISRPFDKPESGRIAVKVINHLGDEVMKVFRVD